MQKLSVIIPFFSAAKEIKRSVDSLMDQNAEQICLEIIIINACAENKALKILGEIEAEHPETVMLVHLESTTSLKDMLNIGMEYASGEYVLFLMPGDVLNGKLAEAIESIANLYSPDIISYGITEVMESFAMWEDEPFDYSKALCHEMVSANEKIGFFADMTRNERFYGSAYRLQFIRDNDLVFGDDCSADDICFLFPCFLKAGRVVTIGDHGYIKYCDETCCSADIHRITDSMKAQTDLLIRLQSDAELYTEYKDLILAHFLKRYYIDNVYLAKASRDKGILPLTVFNLMKYTIDTVVPDWIYNGIVYGFGRNELEYLAWLNKEDITETSLKELLSKNSLVTVVVTTFNRAKELRNTLENILSQTWQNIELIVVNDGSSDDTEEVVKNYSDSRIRYIANPGNKGVSYSRNAGIEAASGDFLVYHDDDDHSRLEKLDKQVRFLLNASEEIGMVYHETINHKARLLGRADKEPTIIPSRNMPDSWKSGFIYPALLPKNFVACTSMMFRTKCIKSIEGFDEMLVAYEDWDLTLRFCKEYNVGFIREPLYDYYQGENGLISSQDEDHRRRVIQALHDIDVRYKKEQQKYGIKSLFVLTTK